MPYSEELADRIRSHFQNRDILFVEKKMMGGLCFIMDDKMCVGVVNDQLMARIGPEAYAGALTEDGVQEMNFTGRPMMGYVFVQSFATEKDTVLTRYIDMSIAFNPLAKNSKKKSSRKSS